MSLVWLVLGLIAESDAADCRAQGDLVGLCGDPGTNFLFIGIRIAAVWVVGAVVILAVIGVGKR